MPNGPHNGSALLNPQLVEVALSPQPGAPGLRVQAFADIRTAPNEGAAMQSVMVLALAWDRMAICALLQRVAALEIAVVEGQRVRDAEISDAERVRAATRLDLMLREIQERADAMDVEPGPVVEPDPERVEPASALDALAIGSEPPPAASGPVDDGGD